MSIKKSLLLLLILAMVFSCKQEELLDQNHNIVTRDLTADLSQYDNSNLGLYKGTFTTVDGSERGIVEIRIISNALSRATLSLSSGATIALESNSIVKSEVATKLSFVNVGDKNTNESFENETDKDIRVSFDLSVKADGTNISITNTIFESNASHIIAAKETSRVPVVPIAGTFLCTSCGTTNWTSGRTFNLLFIGDPTGEGTSSLDTDFTVNGEIFSSVGTTDNNQIDCASNGSFIDCTISGFTNVNPLSTENLTWTGIHKYDSSSATCSQVVGTWAYSSASYGDLEGTFTSDLQCISPVNDYCDDAITVADGSIETGSTSFANADGAPTVLCGIDDASGPGVWYRYLSLGHEDGVSINTCHSNYNTALFVYDDECNPVSCVISNNDSCGIYSSVGFNEGKTIGKEFFIYVTGYEGDKGAFVLNVTTAPPVGYDVTSEVDTTSLLSLPPDPVSPIDATAFVSFGQPITIPNIDFTTEVDVNDYVIWKGMSSIPGHKIYINSIEPTTPLNFFNGTEPFDEFPEGEIGLNVTSGNPGEEMSYLIHFQIEVDGTLESQEYFTDPKIRIR